MFLPLRLGFCSCLSDRVAAMDRLTLKCTACVRVHAQAPMLASVANVTPLARALRVLPQHSGYQRSEVQQRVLGLPIRAYQSAELAPAEAATPKRVFADWTGAGHSSSDAAPLSLLLPSTLVRYLATALCQLQQDAFQRLRLHVGAAPSAARDCQIFDCRL